MATFWERAAHSVNRVFSLLCLSVASFVSHFGFEGRTLVLIASVSGLCLLILTERIIILLTGYPSLYLNCRFVKIQ